jgi:toxin ParE1/3/4
MREIVLSHQAIEDLAQICDYLEEYNPAVARKVMRNLRNKIQLLASNPRLGIARDDLLLNLRCLMVQDYLVLYEPREDVIDIVYVRHSKQDLRDLFLF